jgi:hypothetical protein
LISYPKLWDLYEEIGLLERAVYANRDSFVNDLTKVITAVVRSPGDMASKNNEISKGFNRLSAEFFFKVKDLLP